MLLLICLLCILQSVPTSGSLSGVTSGRDGKLTGREMPAQASQINHFHAFPSVNVGLLTGVSGR